MSLADYVTVKPMIHTEHLCIRPMNANDVSALKEWMSDRSIYTYWGKGPSKAEKNPELLFEKLQYGFLQIIMARDTEPRH